MFNIFKKEDKTNHDILILDFVTQKCFANNGTYDIRLYLNEDWKSIRFLNKRGLIKYYKTDKKDVYTITLTLFCLYLTKIKKYDIEKVYNEATKLYDLIGGEKNDVHKRTTLF